MSIDQVKLDGHVERCFGELSASYGGLMMSLGHKLGLYKALDGAGPLTSSELARRTGCAERYVREWLGSETAAGSLAYDPATGTYELSPEMAMILAREQSPVFMPSAMEVVASMWADQAKAVEAFRTGKGVAWGDHDERLFCGVAAFFRNSYAAHLVSEWLPALDGVVEQLEAGIEVADIGCGHGYSTLLMAEAFPRSRFRGFDVHAGSIAEARRNAVERGLGDRVGFEVAGADDFPGFGYGLVCYFDCLHDMGRPLAALEHAAAALAGTGSLMLVEPFAGDRVEENMGPVGRLYYAASTTLCCAHAISEKGTHVLGAQAGEKRLAGLCREAGLDYIHRAASTPFNIVLQARR